MEQLFSARHWQTDQVVDINVSRGKVISVTPSDKQSNLWIAPGLIDVQLNGIGGLNLNTIDLTVEDITRIVKMMQQGGVTRFCPTVVTGPKERMLHCIRIIAEACATDPLVNYAVIGIHVEGPFISEEDGPWGAHNKKWVRDPSEDEFMEWLGVARGKITLYYTPCRCNLRTKRFFAFGAYA